MTYAELMDTPRLFTALAEWCACFIYILLLRKKIHGARLIFSLAGALIIQILYQFLAGTLPLYMWIPGMIGAITIMFFTIYLICDISAFDSWFCCIRAFVLAEFSASLGWQLFVWWALRFQKADVLPSYLIISVCYTAVFITYFFLEKGHLPNAVPLNVGKREVLASGLTALSVFIMSNLSFIMPDSPFSSATSSIFYVRTLVDFGGIIMLFAQQDKREEYRLRSENQAMNVVLQRQYDQYCVAQDNMDLLRREFHDLKHYMIAIRSETDPYRKEHYLSELENAIYMQEALMNTGNKVLDVILTTKSSYCIQKKITFSCMADGNLVHFIDVKDICSIFGNAMDNAIECVEKYEDGEKRVINLSMYQKNRLLMIQVENYYEDNLIMDNNLPITTKSNKSFHGYGLKSIRLAAEQYGGTMTVHAKDNWFTLQILIPVQD